MPLTLKNALRAAMLITLGGAAAACESLEIASTPEVRGTGNVGKVRVSALSVTKRPKFNIPNELRSEPVEGRELTDEQIKSIYPAVVVENCFTAVDSKRINDYDGGAFTIPLIMAGVDLVSSHISNEIKESAAAKIKRFEAKYDGQVNVESFGGRGKATQVRCIELTRVVNEREPPASHIVLALMPIGENAIELKPVYVKLSQLAASTAPKKGGPSVALAITVGIETLASDGGDLLLRNYQRNLALSDVTAGQVYNVSASSPSAIIPRPNGQPATIAMVVTEKGSGIQSLSDFESAFDANSKTIRTAIGSSISARLEEAFKD